MSQESHLVEILCTLSDYHVDFVVAGGVAMVLHGVERTTLDLDVAVSLEPGNLRRFLQALASLRLVPRAPVPAEIILDQQRIAELIREKMRWFSPSGARKSLIGKSIYFSLARIALTISLPMRIC